MHFAPEVDFLHSWENFQADRLYKRNDTYQYKCGGVKAYKKEEVLHPVAVRRSKTPELKLNFIRGNENVTHSAQSEFSGRNGFFVGIVISQTTDCHVIVISQTADFHFANYRFSFRKLQIFISFRSISFRKLQ